MLLLLVPESRRVSDGDNDKHRNSKLDVKLKVNVCDVAESTLKIIRHSAENERIPYYGD
jgi:hypothetical protein